jgi:hypothetical protein
MRISECAALLEQYVTLLEKLSKLKTRLGRVENSNLKELVLAEIKRLQTTSLLEDPSEKALLKAQLNEMFGRR